MNMFNKMVQVIITSPKFQSLLYPSLDLNKLCPGFSRLLALNADTE